MFLKTIFQWIINHCLNGRDMPSLLYISSFLLDKEASPTTSTTRHIPPQPHAMSHQNHNSMNMKWSFLKLFFKKYIKIIFKKIFLILIH